MNIVVVIPTYNEINNINKIIPVTVEVLLRIKNHNSHILVVDDSSPDGTGDAVIELSKKYPNVHLLTKKEKTGLGAAYVFAFKHAMKELNADVLIEMDADFQHDPNVLPEFISKIDEGYDYVIGSRFTKGGSIPKEWALYRKFLSVGGNIFSKFVLGIFNVNDFTSGFKASRVAGFVDKLDLDSILSQGFAYKIDLLFRMHQLKAKIIEVPIQFGVRDRDVSKMEKNNMTDTLKVVLMLRFNASKSFFKFIAVGFAGLFTDVAIFNILGLLKFEYTSIVDIAPNYLDRYGINSLIAGFLAIGVTYTLNNLWSFKDREKSDSRSKGANIVLYYLSSYFAILVRSVLVIASTKVVTGNDFIVTNVAFFIGIFFGIIWNYTIYSRVIWNNNKKNITN